MWLSVMFALRMFERYLCLCAQPYKIVCVSMCVSTQVVCVMPAITRTGVIQNRTSVLSTGCSCVIFLLIYRSPHRTLASAFSISPRSRREMESQHLSVFIHFLSLSASRHSAYLRSFFFILLGFLQLRDTWRLFSLLLFTSLSPAGETDICS